jgi:2-keto-3-deoxy-L-rhamnonate aldolase RhmA
MRGSLLRKALHNGNRVYGIGVEGYVQPRWPRFFSDSGLDFVFIDTEHTPLDRMQQAWAVQTYAAYGIAPLLRIPEASASLAAQALDAGAHGIVVPYVETAAQVKELVGAIRYRPFRGRRLAEVLEGTSLPSEATDEYLQLINEDNLLVIMIESQAGLDNLERMLQIKGVDAVLIGPNDLSISLGIPDQITHPKFEKALQEVTQICRKNNVGVGVHFADKNIETEMQWIDWGCNLIIHLTDTLMIAHGIERGLQTLRDHTGDLPPEGYVGEKRAGGGHSV